MLKVTAAAIAAATIAVSLTASPADAARKRHHGVRTSYYSDERTVVPSGRTRITVRKRSYLDGGTEVLPGERKFTDYALPVGALAISPRDPYRGGDIQWNSSSWPPGTFPGF